MRIIAGAFKGKKLITSNTDDFRPSSDRLKESLFNIINSHFKTNLINQNILDIYAGSGAIGLEALSRLAASASFVEKNKLTCNIILKNTPPALLKNINLINYDFLATTAKNYNYKYSLVYLDPPYHHQLYMPSLEHLIKLNILNNNSIVIAESLAVEEIEVPHLTNLSFIFNKIIGKNKLSFFKYQNFN